MDTIILVDGSNMWYRSYVATPLDKPGGPVYIMTRQLRKLCDHYGRDNVIVCWDAGRSGRKELDSEYKAKRTTVEGVWEDLSFMKRMVDAVGIRTAYKKGYEADDVIGSLATTLSNPILIHSTDKDFYQLVTDRVRVLRPRRKIHGREIPEKIIEYEDVVEEFGFSPQKTLLIKAFKGDTSDNIPKIDIRFTKKFKEGLDKALTKANSVEEVYENLDCFDKKYLYELTEFKDRALLNEKLIKIHTDLDVEVQQEDMSEEGFESLCEECGIKNLKFGDWTSLPKEPAPPPPIQRGLF